jgi:hypothetical protein
MRSDVKAKRNRAVESQFRGAGRFPKIWILGENSGLRHHPNVVYAGKDREAGASGLR